MADRRRHVRQHARRVWYSLLPPIVLNRIRGPDDDQVPLLDTNNEDENADRRGVICMMTSEIPNGPESPLEGGDDAEQAETTETSPGHEHHEAAPDTLGQLNLAPRGPPPNLMPTCDMFTQQTPAVEHDFMGNQFANAVAFSGTNGYIPLPPNPGNNLIDTSQTAFGMNNFGGELIQNFQFDAFYTGSNVNEPRFNNVNGEGVVSDTVSTQDQMHSSINGSDGSSFTEMFQFDAEDDRMFGGAVRNPITSPFSQTTANNLVGLGTQQPAWASHANQYRCPPENSFHVGNPYELNEYGIPYHSVRQPVWNNSHVPDQHDPEYWGNACTKVEDEE